MNKILSIALFAILLAGCRGMTSNKPPVHPNSNMDVQEKYVAQSTSDLFEDKRAMRMPISGTVARGKYLATDADVLKATGRTATGYVQNIPIKVDAELLKLGQKKFNTYCAPCHSPVGDGNGIVWRVGKGVGMSVQPTSLHDPRLKAETDGYLFGVVRNGIRNMSGYGSQIPNPRDRWAIVSYIRALQRSQSALPTDLPASIKAEIDKNKPAETAPAITAPADSLN